ncbi:hypothetical protein [Massilia pseudoviolaceinigra]|uniref:hypothetical protein n=1 Tax=Massilia pseudoviolaceinigra TaxID=3057165 RepID=UPI0027969842|nr:hypothetical protein [Massilia sp. CCM 9206]MDQ1921216.1 hypothetical protein [Massilia sp. CCM 9206]
MADGLSRLQAKEAIHKNCGAGWLPLADEVFDKLPSNIIITCAFQKFGALRFDWDPRDDGEFDAFLKDVAQRSLGMCETCGEAGIEMIIDSWVVTRCDPHCAGYVWRSDQP